VVPHPVGLLAPTDLAEMAQAALEPIVAALTSPKDSLRLDYMVDYTLPEGMSLAEEECEDCKV